MLSMLIQNVLGYCACVDEEDRIVCSGKIYWRNWSMNL
jgi:hypothetical protein